MGQRGPAPTPAPILQARGTLRKDRVHNFAVAPEGRPVCPSWVDDEAKAAWKQIVPKLQGMRVLTLADCNALARYCQLWSRWKKAELFIQKHGETYPLKDERGKIKCLMPFPQVAIAHKLAAQLTRLEQEFGLTPSARTRIKVEPVRVGDPRKARFFPDAAANYKLSG